MGILLAGILLFDVYQDWALEGNPFWTTLAENAVPLIIALVPPVLGWRFAQGEATAHYLSEATKWTLAVGTGTAAIVGLVFSIQILQGRIKPGIILTQLSTIGTLAGFFLGSSIAKEQRARREARRRADAMEAASDGIAILDSNGIYTFVNQAHVEIYGYDSAEAFIGNSWELCYETEELRRFREEVMPTFSTEGQWRGEAIGTRADDSQFPQELSLTALEDNGIICVVRDITPRKDQERQLREAK